MLHERVSVTLRELEVSITSLLLWRVAINTAVYTVYSGLTGHAASLRGSGSPLDCLGWWCHEAKPQISTQESCRMGTQQMGGTSTWIVDNPEGTWTWSWSL
jgi:hypothetical protein